MDLSYRKSSRLMNKSSHRSMVILMLAVILGGFVAMVGSALVPSGEAWAGEIYDIRWNELPECKDEDWQFSDLEPLKNSNDDSVKPEDRGKLIGNVGIATCPSTGEVVKKVLIPITSLPSLPSEYGSSSCMAITLSQGTAAYCVGGDVQNANNGGEITDQQLQEAKDSVQENADACRSGQALLSLGWFLCPIMETMTNAVEDLYDSVELMLRIEPTFFTGADNNVNVAWTTFRDIANIIFIILLLAVIFSQITGVGINNYGIKKILPKMIVAAILINLSYVICQIAIDLSNILGNGLENLFQGMGQSLTESLTNSEINVGGDPFSIDSVTANAVLPGAAVLAGVATVAAVFANPFILVSVLISAVSMLISLFFLFLLLVARKAAVIVLVALSPLAFVCYMLPNTKSLFSKWLKAMEGMLLLYPICGLIVGGGGYVSKLLLSTSFGEEGFVQVFAAMVVGIIPIFFIPKLLKSSFAAIGNIGAKISGIGQGLGRRATGAITNTGAYKTAQEMGQRRETRIKSDRVVGRLGDKSNLSFSQRQKLTRAQRAKAGLESEELKGFQMQYSMSDREKLRKESQNAASWINDENGEQRMIALLQQMEAQGMEGDMANMLSKTSDISNKSRVMTALGGSKNAAFSAYGKRGAGIGFDAFMMGRGDQSMKHYLEEKGVDAVSKLDDKSLGLIAGYQKQLDDRASSYGLDSMKIMGSDQLVQAAAQMGGEDSLRSVNEMLKNRDDIKISGDQLAGLKKSTTMELLQTNAGRRALLGASDQEIAVDLKNKMNPEVREGINVLRDHRTDGGDRTAI